MCIHKGKFIIFKVNDGWIVYNTEKEFISGHTHLKSKQSALAAIDFVQKHKIPTRTGHYYLISLIRLSTDAIYIKKINNLIDTRNNKGKKLQYCRFHK